MRHCCWSMAVVASLTSIAVGAGNLPEGSAPPALEFAHFPSRMHAFVWRNWPVVEAERLARVLGTSRENVAAVAASMGLPPQGPIGPEWKTRGYITIVRRNWHLVPYPQLLELLGMTAEELAYALREDDFLFVKLGNLKPKCGPLRYAPPDEAARRRAAEIKRLLETTFGADLRRPEEPRFAFVGQLSRATPGQAPPRKVVGKGQAAPVRYIYSYFAMFGDPLMNQKLDPYPEGLLQRLSEAGVTGIWLHTALRTLAPDAAFPEFGAGHETRLATLRQLVARAKRHGIDVYLYVNEPRAMPLDFFQPNRAGLQGVREGGHAALCTSTPEVRRWLADSLAYVFRSVPELGGVFTITASENLTSCESHGRSADCPRCRLRKPAEIIAEVNATIAEGVKRGSPSAKVIAWDWGWPDDQAPEIIARLPKSVWLQSVSEWSLPIRRGGVATVVGEYSISAVGPGPQAVRHWELARKAGLKTVAKVQLNNTWELSAVPYLPVLDLVAQHAENLATSGVDGAMLSWSLGGYPSPNLEVAARFAADPKAQKGDVLDWVAEARFGPGAANARKAWTRFSRAFEEYPYHMAVLYHAPQQFGPANLLYSQPTGYRATMVGMPYDDLNGWCGPYPADVFADQFAKVAEGWRTGLDDLRRAAELAPLSRRAEAEAEWRFASAARLHFASVANQARFTHARNRLLDTKKPLPLDQRKDLAAQMRKSAEAELQLAVELFRLVRADSRIGYEASNHYYYLPIDLMEKVINCRLVADVRLLPSIGANRRR